MAGFGVLSPIKIGLDLDHHRAVVLKRKALFRPATQGALAFRQAILRLIRSQVSKMHTAQQSKTHLYIHVT
jgi:hypothetical protein